MIIDRIIIGRLQQQQRRCMQDDEQLHKYDPIIKININFHYHPMILVIMVSMKILPNEINSTIDGMRIKLVYRLLKTIAMLKKSI